MSEKGSVFQKGGGGTSFEEFVQTAFLTTLIISGNAPSLPANEIIEVSFQNSNKGYETDDLFILSKSDFGTHRLLIQIKHDISFTAGNDIFQEVINAFWKDYNNEPIFDKEKDKLIVVKNGLTKDERNHLKTLFNWASTHATDEDFILEVNRIKGKQDRLNVFRECLKKANGDTSVSDKQLWEFLKCMDVLEYDFLNQTSADKTYFLNLIKLSKSKHCILNEEEIWNAILSYVIISNKDGGNCTTASIQNEHFYIYFSVELLSPYFNSIQKLKGDGEAILRPFKDTISGVHLIRNEINELLVESINSNQWTIISGKPGAGKSATVKNLIKNSFQTSSVFIFRADQFNQPHLANVLSNQGINEPIEDIFSCMSLISEKILFIDSLEKLLEADPECAFKQLQALLENYPGIKVIASSRKYAIDLIIKRFGINRKHIGIVEILPLNDNEFGIISDNFPQISGVLKNQKIKSLLQSPKYLDFAIKALDKTSEDYSNLSLSEFKLRLWESLVVDSTSVKNGMPIKREKAFMEIAVKRAKEMKLFTEVIDSDPEAITVLERDEIISQEPLKRRYTPSHDILEDWALVRYVEASVEEYTTAEELFDNLGNEPAIRRAFRLWVEDSLIENTEKINELIKATLSNKKIEKYWADELLVAIFKSEENSFFSTFEKVLISDKRLLNRIIHVLKTCCKETNPIDSLSLLPIGSGWQNALIFLDKHFSELSEIKLTIINFVLDWQPKLVHRYSSIHESELLAGKAIVLKLIEEIESSNDFWKEDYGQENSSKLIPLLYDLAPISREEIKLLVQKAYDKLGKDWQLNSFYKSVIHECLSGLRNQKLSKELPELVIEVAWKEWKLPPPTPRRKGSLNSLIIDTVYSRDNSWGIKEKYSFTPSGIYKTPLYHLLSYNPSIALKFITEFLNYSVDFYVNANYKHDLKSIEIELNDGLKCKQWGALQLWEAYRGTRVTHYAIESILMSLEKFMLDLAERETNESRKDLKDMFDFLLRNSNSVLVSSVLLSVTFAYPNQVEEAMLPLLKVKEFYKWDLDRSLSEASALSPVDYDIPFAQSERSKLNQLPHRKKFWGGLRGFVLVYQAKIGQLNTEIHDIIDKFKEQADSNDWKWKKMLADIDLRNHKIGEFDSKIGGYPILPQYDKDLAEHLAEGREDFKTDSYAMNFAQQLTNAYEEKQSISFDDWLICYGHYSTVKKPNVLFDLPVTLAAIGLRDFITNVDTDQKNWCFKTIKSTISRILSDLSNRTYGFSFNYNLLEKEIALHSSHLLFQCLDSEEEKNELILFVIFVLTASLDDHEKTAFQEYFRTIFFQNRTNETKKIWNTMIHFSKFKKENPITRSLSDKDHKEMIEKENRFLKVAISENSIVNPSINFLDYDPKLLLVTYLITPYQTIDPIQIDYIKTFTTLIFEDVNKGVNSSKGFFKSIDYTNIQFNYLPDLLLYALPNIAFDILDLILSKTYESESLAIGHNKPFYDFSFQIIKAVIIKLDRVLINSIDKRIIKNVISNFWNLWVYLFEQVTKSGKPYFIEYLLLNIQWREEAKDWEPLEGKRDEYKRMVETLGPYSAQSVVNVLSTIGDKMCMPDGLIWLVDIYKKHPRSQISLFYPQAEILIQRLFYSHISEIKSKKQLINDFLWLLNIMVEFGSSEAYLFRENVITYKMIN